MNLENHSFVKKVNSIENKIEAEVVGVYPHDKKGFEMSEDDGAFFVCSGGVRVAFSIGQEVSRREFNRQANQILKALDYKVRYNATGTV